MNLLWVLSTLEKDAGSISREVLPKMPAWKVQRSQLRSGVRYQGPEDLVVSDGGIVYINLTLSERYLELRAEFLQKSRKITQKESEFGICCLGGHQSQNNSTIQKNFLCPFLSSLLQISAPSPSPPFPVLEETAIPLTVGEEEEERKMES